ncbi:MAG: serine hydrolase domain-containing protein [Bacteroidia bacterium]
MQKFTILFLLPLLIIFSCQNEKPSKELTDPKTEIKYIEENLLPAIIVKGKPTENFSMAERMEYHKVPGVSIAVLKDGKIRWTKSYGFANTNTGTKVNENTLFQAGSISKPLAALAALKLAEEGKIDLGADVNTYLTGWKIPDSKFLEEEDVTITRLLTHTAGMTVHGFPGYTQTDTFPDIETVLKGEGNTPAIFVDTFPGAMWRYSGGGYTVMEKVVEDVSGMPLEAYMAQNILKPMGLENSTYEQPLPEPLHANASAAYDNLGNIIEGLWHNYPEQAAAGLWTTPTDLAKYFLEIQGIYTGEKEGILSQEMVKTMLTKHENGWGLGPGMQKEGDSLMFGHGGKNAGFTNNMMAFANHGAGVVVMTNADNGGRLIAEIIRAVSAYYDWNITKPRVVETIELDEEKISKLTGTYIFEEQVDGIGDYLVDAKIEDGQLVVVDPNNNETDYFTPLEPMKFINLNNGNEVVFEETEDDGMKFVWNGRFHFTRVK